MTPSAPDDNIQGCFGWNAILKTPTPPITPCPVKQIQS